MYMYIAFSSGKKCLLKDLEFAEIGAKAIAMCEHLRGIHKVGNFLLCVYIYVIITS